MRLIAGKYVIMFVDGHYGLLWSEFNTFITVVMSLISLLSIVLCKRHMRHKMVHFRHRHSLAYNTTDLQLNLYTNESTLDTLNYHEYSSIADETPSTLELHEYSTLYESPDVRPDHPPQLHSYEIVEPDHLPELHVDEDEKPDLSSEPYLYAVVNAVPHDQAPIDNGYSYAGEADDHNTED